MTAMFTTYNHPFPGREREALELAIQSSEFWGKLAAEGKCSAPEQFLSLATGKGYWIVKGDREDLQRAMDSPEGTALNVRAMALLEGYTLELVPTDGEVDELLMAYGGELPS